MGRQEDPTDVLSRVPGDAAATARVREALGPPDRWPEALRVLLRITLGAHHPVALLWGPELRMVYNAAYARLLLGKHPEALGRPTRDVFREVRDVIDPLFERVLRGGESVMVEDQLLVLQRRGFLEECYATFSYVPAVTPGGGAEGILVIVTETTERVLRERRSALLRALADSLESARTSEDVWTKAARALATDPFDVPFALAYRLEGPPRRARLAGRTGLPPDHPACPDAVPLARTEARSWPLFEAMASPGVTVVSGLRERFGALPATPWDVPPDDAVVLGLGAPNGGPPLGALVLGVSPRRPLDAAYEELFRNLAERIAGSAARARHQERERASRERAEARSAAREHFLAVLGHELRRPLGSLRSALDVLPLDLEAPARQRLVEIAVQEVDRLRRMVDELLDLAQVSRGELRLERRPLDLARLVAEALDRENATVEAAGLRLLRRLPDEPLVVEAEASRVAQIVASLVAHAVQATPAGGTVEVDVRRGTGRSAEVLVRDTGRGLPEAELERLFRPFDRRPAEEDGLGLGLAVARAVAQAHGGSLTAWSEGPSRGSELLLTLPLPDAAPEARPAREAGRLRILVIDDHEDSATTLAEVLARLGHQVEVARDAGGGLEVAARRALDVVLCDIGLPDLDGYEVARRLRAGPGADLTLVALTGYAGADDAARAVAAGFDAHLPKPVDLPALRRILERARSRDAPPAAPPTPYDDPSRH